jgi:hypothetical protein
METRRPGDRFDDRGRIIAPITGPGKPAWEHYLAVVHARGGWKVDCLMHEVGSVLFDDRETAEWVKYKLEKSPLSSLLSTTDQRTSCAKDMERFSFGAIAASHIVASSSPTDATPASAPSTSEPGNENKKSSGSGVTVSE